jgi:peptidoglycan/LPS O-acetylase OafA/YrhL
MFPAMNPLLRAPLVLVVTMGLAALMYVGIEKPCARLRKRLTD